MKEMLRRSARTFFQAAAGYVATNIVAITAGAEDIDYLKSALIGLGVSAVSAGIAALMNKPKKNTEND